MKLSESRQQSKNIIITACVFLIGLLCWGVMLQDLYTKRILSLREHCRLDAVVFADELQQDFSEGESIVKALALTIGNSQNQSAEGLGHVMEIVASRTDIPLDSILLAPNGVVAAVYPDSRSSALGYDIFAEPKRKLAMQYSLQAHAFAVIGPIETTGGGMVMAIVNPVFLHTAGDKESLWGFANVLVKVPDIFAKTVANLDQSGLAYRLEKTGVSHDGYVTILESDVPPTDPVSYTFSYGGCQWHMQVAPKDGWQVMGPLSTAVTLGFLTLIMLTVLTYVLLYMRDRQKRLRRLAMTDQLTGLLNRHGLESVIQERLNQDKMDQAIFVQLDIDDFKLINDIFGHRIGDEALRHLAVIMRVFFPREAVLARNGGDEFIIVLPTRTIPAAERMVRDFVSLKKEFNYKQMVYQYTISMGYAVYAANQADGKSPLDVLRDADTALYMVKLRGKNGCCRYVQGMAATRRVQMGVSLRDVVFNLPASILIYDAESEEILFANQELISLFECDDLDDLLAYTKRRFRGIVHPDDYEQVDTSIWQQVYACNLNKREKANDAVNYRIVTKHGRVRWVIDRGRLVQSDFYGRIFYVILVPDERMDAVSDKADQ